MFVTATSRLRAVALMKQGELTAFRRVSVTVLFM